LPVRYQLYLPEDWAGDAARRKKAGVPAEVSFKTKPEIALEQLRWASRSGLPRGVVLLDAGYGNHTRLRVQIGALGLIYVAGILSSTSVWAPDTAPLPPKRYSGRGRPPTRPRRGKGHKPVSVKELAFGLPQDAWRMVTWREGSTGRLSSRFARLRVRAARRGGTGEAEWLRPKPAEMSLLRAKNARRRPLDS
jgi:SRSO17 transposase